MEPIPSFDPVRGKVAARGESAPPEESASAPSAFLAVLAGGLDGRNAAQMASGTGAEPARGGDALRPGPSDMRPAVRDPDRSSGASHGIALPEAEAPERQSAMSFEFAVQNAAPGGVVPPMGVRISVTAEGAGEAASVTPPRREARGLAGPHRTGFALHRDIVPPFAAGAPPDLRSPARGAAASGFDQPAAPSGESSGLLAGALQVAATSPLGAAFGEPVPAGASGSEPPVAALFEHTRPDRVLRLRGDPDGASEPRSRPPHCPRARLRCQPVRRRIPSGGRAPRR